MWIQRITLKKRINMVTIITDPLVEGYIYYKIHPEVLDKEFRGIVSFNQEEVFFLKSKPLNLIYFGGNQELETRTPQRPYVLLGPYGNQMFDGSDELKVHRKIGYMYHTTHWHPSCRSISLERLVNKVEGDILECARDFREVKEIDVMVLDLLWVPVAEELKKKYTPKEFRYPDSNWSSED